MNNEKKPAGSYYLPIGMCLGLSVGTAIGSATGSMGMWMPLGICFGLCIGILLDRRNRKDPEDTDTDTKEE